MNLSWETSRGYTDIWYLQDPRSSCSSTPTSNPIFLAFIGKVGVDGQTRRSCKLTDCNARYKVHYQLLTFSAYTDLHALAAGFCIAFFLPVLGGLENSCSYHVVLLFLFWVMSMII